MLKKTITSLVAKITLLGVVITAFTIVYPPVFSVTNKDAVDYSLYVTCIDKTTTSYTAYFGYINRTNKNLTPNTQSFSKDSVTLPTILQKGQNDKVFSAKALSSETLNWTVTVGDVEKTAIASYEYPECVTQPTEKKITICHAAGRADTDNFVTLTISENSVYGPAGHFYENGTPRAGHEQDYMGACITPVTPTNPVVTPTVNPTVSPLQSQTPSLEPSPTAKATAIATATPVVTAVATASPSPSQAQPSITSSPAVLATPLISPSLIPSNTILITVTPVPSQSAVAPTPSITDTWITLPKEVPITTTVTRPDSIRVDFNTKQDETFSFNENTVILGSTCGKKAIDISFPVLSGTNPIAFAEYSIDGGKNWYQIPQSAIKNGTESSSIKLTSYSFFDGNYQILLKVQTTSGSIFVSQPHDYVHSCSGGAYITAYFIQNGFDVGIKNEAGNYLINRQLPATIYVETFGAFNALLIGSSSSSQTVSLSYDPSEKVWKGDLAAFFANGQQNYNLFIQDGNGNVLKRIDPIDIVTPQAAANNYTYSIFYKSGDGWEQYPYAETTGIMPIVSNSTFSLSSGTYFIKVTYPQNIPHVTATFTLDDRSIVTVNTDKISSVYNLFAEVPFTIQKDASEAPQKVTDNHIDSYIANLLKESTKENSKYVILSFWNTWNPRFDEQLTQLYEASKHENISIVVATDENNIEELQRLQKYINVNFTTMKLDRVFFTVNPENTITNGYIIYEPASRTFYTLGSNHLIDFITGNHVP